MGEIEDLGTEFGLRVTHGGRTQLHVFEGEVRMRSSREAGDSKIVVAGGRLVADSRGLTSVPSSALVASSGRFIRSLGPYARRTLVVGQSQYNSGNVLPSPIIAVSGDLLETSVASVTGENASANVRNGTTGTAANTVAPDPANAWGNVTTTYNLDITTNTLGYNISEIRLFSGWTDGRAGQEYNIEYSLVGAPLTFLALGSVTDPQTNGSLLTRTYDDSGANILSGVAAIQFIQDTVGLDGTRTVFREFDVLGGAVPKPIPEPSTIILTVLGLMGLGCRRRRKRS